MRSCDKLHLCEHLELNEGAYFYKKEAQDSCYIKFSYANR